jgi:beta-glucanase (GH16 family)
MLLRLSLLMVPTATATPPAGYYLVWADEFSGSSLDSTKWAAWSGPNRNAVNTPNAATVSGGYLAITTYTTNGTHYSAILSTDGKFRYRYGYLEASIDFHTTPGMWSGFWLQSPTEGQFIGDPAASGAEIDVCEHRASDTNGTNIDSFVQTTVHWDGYATDHQQRNSGNIGSGLGTGFHSYGCLWDSTNYFFLIDGVQQWATNAGHSDRTEFVLLSSEVQDAYWAGVVPPGGYGDFLTSTTRMVVDYVRYYAPTTTVFWTGGGSTDWSTAGNWLGGRVASADSDIVFSYFSVGNFAVSLSQNTSVGSLSIQEAGPVSVNNKALTLGSGGIDMLSAVSDAAVNSPLVLGAAQTWKVAGGRLLTVNGVMSGTGNLTLSGRGTVALPATNRHSGSITLSNGTLLVSGVTGTNTLTVAGGTLTGAGRITGPVIVTAGGTLAPGTSIGTLTISNNLTLQPGSFASVELSQTAGTCDKVTGLANVTFGGTLRVNNLSGTLASRDAFKLFDAASYSGAFARITPLTPGTNLAWDTSSLTADGTLRVMSTLSPSITAQMSRSQFNLSWPTDHIGWRLQAQTNAPGFGLTTNWATVPGSLTTNRILGTVNPNVGSVFFRLASPHFSTAQFAPGDLVVLQVGNGTIGSAGAPGFLNEYSSAGGPCVYQLPLPTTGASALVFGPSDYGGALSLSPDAQLLVVEGYNVPAGSYSGSSIDTSSTTGSLAIPRAVGSVNAAGTFTLNATTTKFSGSTIRSAVTDGHGNYWAGGGLGGIVYLGIQSPPATLSTVSSASRNLGLFNGRLYFTETGSGHGVMAFSGTPTSAATPTLVLSTDGTGSGTPSPKGFAFNPALTIAYVADNRTASTGGGIQRFNWNGAAWAYAYTLGYTLSSSKQVWDIAADFSASAPVLYAVTGESTANHLVSVTDTGPGSAYTILATAPAGDAFRGVAFAPVQPAQ